MQYKRYLFLERIGNWENYKIRLKIRSGMLSDDVMDVLDALEEWTPGSNERIYFLPGCTVPRFKVREKYKVTIKPEYATSAFVAPGSLEPNDEMFDALSGLVLVPSEVIAKYLESHYGPDHFTTVKFKSLVLNCEPGVLMNRGHYSDIYHREPDDADRPNADTLFDLEMAQDENGIIRSADDLEEQSFYYASADSQFGKIKCPIYNQDAILKLINEDSIVIDEKQYENLRRMGRSADTENIVVVMEVMANANYDKSFIYLCLLLKEFSDKIASRKEASHVNFKGLLNYFELDHRTIKGVTIEHLTKTMKKLNRFTRSNVQRISQLYGNEFSGESSHYTTGPVLKEEVENELDEDIISDFDDVEIPDQSINI